MSLHSLAWLNVVVHLIGLAAAGLCLRPGVPLSSLADRLAYLSSNPIGWTLGWTVWIGCAAALIAFLAHLEECLGRQRPGARLGMIFAVVAFGFDLLCDSLYILVLPSIAAAAADIPHLFLVVERAIGIGSLVIANGFYSAGVVLFNAAMRDQPGMRRFALASGWGVGLFGILLAAAGFTGDPLHAAAATPPTMLLFCVWVVLVARSLEPEGANR